MWIWMLGCAQEVVPVPGTPTVETVVAYGGVGVVTAPPAGAVPWLVLESGHTWDPQDVWFADVNGDGQLDAIGRVWGPTGVFDGLALGPLDNTILPRDFSVLFDYGGWYPSVTFVGELTGEPPADVYLISPGYGQYIVPGPWEGQVTPEATWFPWPYGHWGFLDLDRDGTRDFMSSSGLEDLHITYGPADRFDGPPDVTVDLCPSGSFDGQDPTFDVHAAGDIDGDGAPEISLPHLSGYDSFTCGGFTVSLPPSGHVDAAAGEATREGLVLPMDAAGDWNGDGLPDVLVADDAGWHLHLSPLTFADGQIFPADQVSFDPAVAWVERVPFDRDGDGRAELLVRDANYGAALLDSTLQALAAPFVPQWVFQGDVRAVEQGDRGWVVFMSGEAAWAVDVGPTR